MTPWIFYFYHTCNPCQYNTTDSALPWFKSSDSLRGYMNHAHEESNVNWFWKRLPLITGDSATGGEPLLIVLCKYVSIRHRVLSQHRNWREFSLNLIVNFKLYHSIHRDDIDPLEWLYNFLSALCLLMASSGRVRNKIPVPSIYGIDAWRVIMMYFVFVYSYGIPNI